MKTIRKPTQNEIDNVFPQASKGWNSQPKEFNFWFNDNQIDGEIPPELQGTFFRNGPGCVDVYGTPLSHPIDGDGMVCSVSFNQGKAKFQSKYVDTYTHRKEKEAKKMLFNGQMGSMAPKDSVVKGRFRDPAHTNVFYWGGKLMACHEYTFPHAMNPHTLDTIGPDTLNNELTLRSMSAHYRYDKEKDRLVVISFRASAILPKKGSKTEFYRRKNGLGVYEYDRNWNLLHSCTPYIKGLNYAHDFVMTPDWYIFHMSPFVNVSAEITLKIAKGELSPGESMRHYPGLPSKMVFIERYPKDTKNPKVIQMETEPCHIYHFGTCVQIGEKDNAVLKFNAVCLPPGFTMNWQYKVFLSNSGDAPGVLHQYEANIATGICKRTPSYGVEDTSCEFPVVHPLKHSVKVNAESDPNVPKFVYLMGGAPGIPLPFCDIVKYNVVTKETVRWHSNAVVGEPAFVPHPNATEEDDGWLITQVYDPAIHQTKFVILDAKALDKGPICTLNLGLHIPYGFHGTFTDQIYHTVNAKL